MRVKLGPPSHVCSLQCTCNARLNGAAAFEYTQKALVLFADWSTMQTNTAKQLDTKNELSMTETTSD